MKTFRYHNGTWTPDTVFVFGSNLLGIHGGGAAKFAHKNCGAKWEQGQGYTELWQHNEQRYVRSYALPTVAVIGTPLPLDVVKAAVDLFKMYALIRSDLTFFVTPVGCGLAGFTHEQIAPFFKDTPTLQNRMVPDNCLMPLEWKEILES